MTTYNEVARCPTSYVTIHMAGDYEVAAECIREFTFSEGACYQLTKCDYIYTGGREAGITARVICYPRFPKTDDKLMDEATRLAHLLAERLCQKSFSIENSTETVYFLSDNPLHAK